MDKMSETELAEWMDIPENGRMESSEDLSDSSALNRLGTNWAILAIHNKQREESESDGTTVGQVPDGADSDSGERFSA